MVGPQPFRLSMDLFLVHIDGNCTFSSNEIKTKRSGIQATILRMHNNAVHIECVVFAPIF